MTNREKYITKRDEYDLMMEIKNRTRECPIKAVSGDTMLFCVRKTMKVVGWACVDVDSCMNFKLKKDGCKKCPNSKKDEITIHVDDCPSCIQHWLNEEAKP